MHTHKKWIWNTTGEILPGGKIRLVEKKVLFQRGDLKRGTEGKQAAHTTKKKEPKYERKHVSSVFMLRALFRKMRERQSLLLCVLLPLLSTHWGLEIIISLSLFHSPLKKVLINGGVIRVKL